MESSTAYDMNTKVILFTMINIGISSAAFSVTPSFRPLPQPSFAESLLNISIPVGRDVSLPCVVDNLGSYRVAWIHKNKNTLLSIQDRVIMRNSKYTVSHQNYRTWYLHLTKVDEKDSGHYMCQVNTTPMISLTGYVNVVVAPRIVENETSSDLDIREGSDASLMCVASGSPKPNIKWRREDDGEIPIGDRLVHDFSGTFLNLTKISRLYMGAYLCIASNGIPPSISKRIMLNIMFSPMIWIPNQLVGVAVRNDINLDCHLEAFPEPVTYWTKGLNHVVVISGEQQDSVVTRSGFYKIHMRLKLRNVKKSDYGAYTCIAKNSLGETTGKIRLYEVAPTFTVALNFRESMIAENKYDYEISEYKTSPTVSANNWNSEGTKTPWKSPSNKGSIETGITSRAISLGLNGHSMILQSILCTYLYVISWIL